MTATVRGSRVAFAQRVDSEDFTDPLLGRTIAGKFLIEEALRAGSMGTIYRARHVPLDATVCIKIMHRELAFEPRAARRFHREAKAASRLRHPNSLRVLDFGVEPDGLLYIAMEHLDGRDLFAVLEEDWPLAPRRIVGILSQALGALAAAHDAGVLHRDLKPENIMIVPAYADGETFEEVVKLCDFGIARVGEPEAPGKGSVRRPRRRATEGLIVGTPEYMSPEQARGDALDARSDLYSVGALLYQMLTGRVPFDAETTLGVVLKQINDEPRPPSHLAPLIHPRLEAVCLRALAKKPSDRYSSAREMRCALRAALAAAESEPPPKSTRVSRPSFSGTRTRTLASECRPSPRRRAAAAIVAMTVAMLALAGARWALVHGTVAPIDTDNASAVVPLGYQPP